jgi:hypothetical protein
VDVRDREAVEAMVTRVVQEWSGVESMSWSRMQAAVAVGPWTPRPAALTRRSYTL